MYQKTTLNNGVTLVSEKIPYLSSVTVGIWINIGSRYEGLNESGICHFIEHMFFKGTNKRNASQIAKEIDSVGGIINAFTGKEYTCLYVKVLDKHLSLAFDLLSDIFLSSLFDSREIEKEKEVILQEIRMVEDNPEEYIHDLLWQSVWQGTSLGLSPLGTIKTVQSISRTKLFDYFKKHYLPHRIVVAVAGNFNHTNLIHFIEGTFGSLTGEDVKIDNQSSDPKPEIFIKNKNLEQVHLCLGAKSPSTISPKRHAGFVMNTLLGGNMSSRLFQEIREKRGLVYSIYSFQSSFVDTGLLGIYAGTGKESVLEVLALIFKELKEIKEERIEENELKRAKECLKGNLILALENTDSIMSRLAKNEIYFRKRLSIEEVVASIDKVSTSEIAELATEIFSKPNIALSVLGKVNDKKINRDIFEV